jgi:hypothetical protein
VRARNIYGFGAFSSISTIKASTHPSAPEIVQTLTEGTKVKISFGLPDANGDEIGFYLVEIKSGLDNNWYSSVECDETKQVVGDQMICYATFESLRSSPFLLEREELVEVRAKAQNAIGFGPYSQVNVAGSIIETEPA